METWKDIFCRQVSTGRYWKNLFKDEFDKHKFIDRSDAVVICKKSQSDVFETIINKLDGRIDNSILSEIKQMLVEHLDSDNSSLGM